MVITRIRKCPTATGARQRKGLQLRREQTESKRSWPCAVETSSKQECLTTSPAPDLTAKKCKSLADAPPLSATRQILSPKPRKRPVAADFFTPPSTPENEDLVPEAQPTYDSADIERLIEEEREKATAGQHQAIQAEFYIPQSSLPRRPSIICTPMVHSSLSSPQSHARTEFFDTAYQAGMDRPTYGSIIGDEPSSVNQAVTAKSSSQTVMFCET